MKKRKVLYIGLIVLFVVALAIPTIQQTFGIYKKAHPLEGTFVPTPRPELTFESYKNNTYQPQMEKYLSENFGFRESFIRFYNQYAWDFYRTTQNNSVKIGDDDWLFNDFMYNDYYGQNMFNYAPNTKAMVEKFKRDAKMVRDLQEILRDKGKTLFVCLAPGKSELYGSHLPEYKGEFKEGGVHAIDYFPHLFDSLGVNYINFHKYFSEMIDTTSQQLFLRSSSHWSCFTAVQMADSIFNYMESVSGLNIKEIEKSEPYIAKLHNRDNDIEKLLNLMRPIGSGKYYYTDVKIIDDTTACMPRLLTMGDSFFWGLDENIQLERIFSTKHYWFYNTTVHHDPLHNNTSEIDIVDELLATDIVMIIFSPVNLYDINRRFLSNALMGICNDSVSRKEAFDKIVSDIKGSEVWFASVKKKAENQGISVDQAVENDANYMLYTEPEKFFDNLNVDGVPVARDPRWLAN